MRDIYTDMNSHLQDWSRPQELPEIVQETNTEFASYNVKENENKNERVNKNEEKKFNNTFQISESTYKQLSPILTVGTFVILIGILAYLLLRYRKGSKFLNASDGQKMKISQTLALGPKRHLILLTLGEKEIVIGNHENGMNLLFDNSRNSIIKTDEKNNKVGVYIDTIESITEKTEQKKELAFNGTEKVKFPKYLAESFEKEKSKVEKSKVEKTEDKNTEHVENITNMIRQKLKDMKKNS